MNEKMNPLRPIEVILYDLGNVILPFSHYQIAEKLSRLSQKREDRDPQEIFSYLFDFQHGLVNRFDLGQVSPEEFFQSIKDHLALSISFDQFIPIWTDIFQKTSRSLESSFPRKGDGNSVFSRIRTPSTSIISFQNSP